MKLFLVSQEMHTHYDSYDSFVCAAETEDEARHTYPTRDDDYETWHWDSVLSDWFSIARDGVTKHYHGYKAGEDSYEGWVHADDVQVKYLGEADPSIEKGVVCSSYNAG